MQRHLPLHKLVLTWVPLLLLVGTLVAQQHEFEDATDQVGLSGLGGGVAAWVDVNNDDWPDLYVSGQLWKNNQGSFVQVADHGLNGSGCWADLDNDGDQDFFAFDVPGAVFLNQLADGKVSFSRVDSAIPDPLPMKVSLGAGLADFDGDGLIDIYLGGYEIWQESNYHDLHLRNLGGGKFKEVWRTEGSPQPARGIATCDFDEDGDVDVYVSNYRLARNFLWRNDSSGNFENVVEAMALTDDGSDGYFGHTIGSAIGDLDSDGHFDVFVGNFSHPPEWQDRPRFFRNRGPDANFGFEEKTSIAGLRWQESYASPTLGDYDNDGLLDLFFTTVYAGDKSVLYHNQGGWKFHEVTPQSTIVTAQTYQAAWADFDGDGFLDLVSGGRLFRNPGGGNDWVKVKLTALGNRPTAGAQVRIRIGERVITRQVSYSTGQGNQNDSVLHFGLGNAAPETIPVEIRWGDGTVETRNAEKNSLNNFKQSDE